MSDSFEDEEGPPGEPRIWAPGTVSPASCNYCDDGIRCVHCGSCQRCTAFRCSKCPNTKEKVK